MRTCLTNIAVTSIVTSSPLVAPALTMVPPGGAQFERPSPGGGAHVLEHDGGPVASGEIEPGRHHVVSIPTATWLNPGAAKRSGGLIKMGDALTAIRHFDPGRFTPLIGEVLSLDDVAGGHRMLEEGNVAGKLVITVAD